MSNEKTEERDETSEDIFFVEVIKVPEGEPEGEHARIKEAWVGVVLPVHAYVPNHSGVKEISGKPVPPQDSCLICQDKALEALEKRNPEAASWYRERGFPMSGMCFAFKIEEVAEVDVDEDAKTA